MDPAALIHPPNGRWRRSIRRVGALGVTVLIPILLASGPLAAQRGEFTRQSILVNTFESSDRKLGRAIAGDLRSRLQRLYPRTEVAVISPRAVGELVEGSGVDESLPMESVHLRAVARSLRADEIINGVVQRTAAGVRVTARLILVRDERLVQPIPAAEAPTADSAAALLATFIRGTRRQLVPHRRCENALREGLFKRAIESVQDSASRAPTSTLGRTCLLSALIQSGAPAADLLREATTILETVPASYWALDAAARAYDALAQREQAAGAWLRLAATDTANLDLQRRVITQLLQHGNAARATPLVVTLSDQNPDDFGLLRLRWQALFATKAWAEATVTGARLLEQDSLSRRDSTFVLRLASAYKANGDAIRATALAADGVSRFPNDPRLYVLYSELVQGESSVTIARGVERFPKVADLHLLRAQELRRSGKAGEAVEPLRRAVELDPTLGQGFLQLAQSQSEMGMPDSAYVSIRRAIAAGEDSATVAQFALARGNALYKSANESKQREAFLLAMRFLALSDSVRSSPQSRFLLGASALAVSQSAATDAPKTNECELSRLAGTMLPLAREKLTSGAQVAPDASRQYLEYLDQLEPIVARQIETLCQGG